MGDLVFGVDPRDRERLRDVLAQSRAWYRSTLVNDGLGTARRQAARGLSPAAALDHLTMSREALRLIEKLAGEFDTWAEDLMRRIERIRDFLLARARWTASFTGSDGVFTLLERTLGEWSGRMRGEPVRDKPLPFEPCAAPPREGLAAALDTAFCVKAMPAPHLSDPAAPLFRAGAYLATFDYLLPQIRFKGNAYGAGAAYDDGLGTFHLYSFRDPRIAETLAVFDGFRAFAQGASWTQTDVDRGIIGCARDAERPIRPGEATASALTRHVRGDTNERRERRYEALLRATPGTVQEALLGVLDRHEPAAAVCVVSSRERLAEANRALGARGLSVADILT
jgi:Zn-dependent M16 (insulinase) family peptidase